MPRPSHASICLIAAAWLLADPAPAAALVPGDVVVTGSQLGQSVRPGAEPAPVFRVTIANNAAVGSAQVTGISLKNLTTGTGTQTQRDQDWQKLRIRLSGAATYLDSASVSSAAATFGNLNISIPPNGGAITLEVTGGASLTARDGDNLDLQILNAAAITVTGGASGTFPISPAGNFPVDGMVSRQVTITNVNTPSFTVGARNNLVFNVVVPANGYQSDELNGFSVVNLGTGRASEEIKKMVLWADDGDGVFEPGGATGDRQIRDMSFTGDQWKASGIHEAVPASGQRFFVAVEIDGQAEGRTIQIALPPPPAVALTMLSGNDGLLDTGLVNTTVHTIAIKDRVTIAAGSIPGGTPRPGTSGLLLMDMIATNKYAGAKQLTRLTVTNSASGPGTQSELDGETEALTLYDDSDNSGNIGPGDQVLGTAFFVAGRATFTGLSWTLAPGETRHLLMTGDASLLHARDGDALGVTLVQAGDLEFANATALSPVFPVTSGDPWTIDGMVARQVDNRGAPAATLGPGDGPVLALDVVVPRNGYRDDELDRVTLANVGSAPASNLAELRLWKDGGDGLFDAGAGDDQNLGALITAGGGWASNLIAVPVGSPGARLFVSVTAAATITDAASVQLEIVRGGLEMLSANDGPLDEPVTNPEVLTLSDRALTAAMSASPSSVVAGQNVAVQVTVRNNSSETISSLTPSAPAIVGSAGMAYISGPSPPSLSLGPGAEGAFAWSFTATSPGEARFTGSASGVGSVSGTTRTSLPATSNVVQVFDPPGSLPLSASTAMPLSVNRGQTGVVPVYLTFSNAAETPGPGVRLTRVRFRLEALGGAGIIPANLLSRVVLFSGVTTYVDRTSLETSGAEVDLVLTTPILITRGAPFAAAVAFDVLASTTVPNFRIVFPDSTYFTAEDATTGAPLRVKLGGQPYPIRTGLARVVDKASEVDVASVLTGARKAGQSQIDAPLLTARLTNPGTTGVTSDVRVASLAVILRDGSGAPVFAPGNVLTNLRVRAGLQLIADQPIDASADSIIDLTLSPLLSVPVNSPLNVAITADLSSTAPLGTYRLSLASTAFFDARDPNSGDAVTVLYANTPLAGDSVTIEAAAESLAVQGRPQLPASLGVGATGVVAMHAILRHPGVANVAPIRLDSLTVRCVDEARDPLIPALYVDRMHLLWNGLEVASLDTPPATGNAMRLGLSGLRVMPGDSDTITLVLDFENSSPSTTFELTLNVLGILASDANTGSPVTIAPDNGAEFPLQSGVTRLSTPARTLLASLNDLMPAALVADGGEVEAGMILLRNDAPPGSGTIIVDRMTLRAADTQRVPSVLGAGVERVRLYDGSSLWGESVIAPGDTTATVVGPELTLAPSINAPLGLRFVPRANATVAAFRVGFTAADVGVVQPGNPLFQVAVLPPAGQVFPLWTAATSFSVASLEQSYANFPNPFAAGRERTTFAYYLPSSGRVTLRIWTPRGERVMSVLDDEPRAAGLHQADAWDGRNGSGAVVSNGVYVAEIIVKLDGEAPSRRLLRKVAVVR